ncbi:MAG: hypothetical protein R3B72_45365 [Polyangiaceae bacterium]
MQRLALRVTFALVGLGGCSWLSGLDDLGPIPEGAGGAAAGGTSSVGGLGGRGDGGMGDGGAPPGCDLPSETFEGSYAADVWEPWGHDQDASSGVLVLSWPALATAGAGLITQDSYDLRGCAIHFELTEPPSEPGVQAFFYARVPASTADRVGFRVFNGKLFFSLRVADSEQSGSNITFDPVQHRWLRLRHASGKVFWDTSSDGQTWTERVDALEPPFDLGTVELHLGGFQAVGIASSVAFDNIGP